MSLIKVLVADDELLVRIGLRTTIEWEKNGFTIVGEAKNGKEAIDLFVSYDWPGNIRELKNLIERLVVINTDGSIGKSNILQSLNSNFLKFNSHKTDRPINLKEYLKAYEKTLIATALKQWDSKRKTAKALGIDHATLIRKCREHGFD